MAGFYFYFWVGYFLHLLSHVEVGLIVDSSIASKLQRTSTSTSTSGCSSADLVMTIYDPRKCVC